MRMQTKSPDLGAGQSPGEGGVAVPLPHCSLAGASVLAVDRANPAAEPHNRSTTLADARTPRR